jgi:hypothetical protein
MMSLIEHNDSLSSRIAGFSESLECGDGGVRGDFRAALAEVDALEAQVANLRGAVDVLRGVLSGRVVLDETEGGEPILLDLATDPATVVRIDRFGGQ